LRGEGKDDSYLLRQRDDKRCCLGFYGQACGIADDDLRSLQSFASIDKVSSFIDQNFITSSGRDSEFAIRLMTTNDAVCGYNHYYNDELVVMTETLREQSLIELFAEAGITVIFEN